jgi:hypothetical protein
MLHSIANTSVSSVQITAEGQLTLDFISRTPHLVAHGNDQINKNFYEYIALKRREGHVTHGGGKVDPAMSGVGNDGRQAATESAQIDLARQQKENGELFNFALSKL